LPKKRRPPGKPGDQDEADVGTVGYGIEAINRGAACKCSEVEIPGLRKDTRGYVVTGRKSTHSNVASIGLNTRAKP
jgi:hypothetical protein